MTFLLRRGCISLTVFLLLVQRWGPPPALFRPACAGLLLCVWSESRAAKFLGSVWWQIMVTLSSSPITGKRYENYLNLFFIAWKLESNHEICILCSQRHVQESVQYNTIHHPSVHLKNNWQYKKIEKCNAHSFKRGHIIRKRTKSSEKKAQFKYSKFVNPLEFSIFLHKYDPKHHQIFAQVLKVNNWCGPLLQQ